MHVPWSKELNPFYKQRHGPLRSVNPANKPRHCLTIWLDSPVANEDACALPWPGMQGQIDESFAVYAKPTVQRRLARSVYAEEYEVCAYVNRMSPITVSSDYAQTQVVQLGQIRQ